MKRNGLIAVPPDGGWGWVIVAVSFYCCAIVDGMISVFGVLFQNLVAYYEASPNQLSLAGSFLPGFFLLSGPFVSICINNLGCRFTTILGGLLSSAAFFSSIFATNSIIFIFTFGFCGGIGLGLIYIPASVMVGYYFEKKRGLAAGISCAGAGAGILILSPLAAYLNDLYSHKGCIMIMAGICLNCVVCGALMRPIRMKYKKSFEESYLPSMTCIPVTIDELGDEGDVMVNDEVIYARSSNNANDFHHIENLMLVENNQEGLIHPHLAPAIAGDNHSKQQALNRLSLHSASEIKLGSKSPRSSRLSLLMIGDAEMPLRKKDILYSGSIASLHQNESYFERVSNQHDDALNEVFICKML